MNSGEQRSARRASETANPQITEAQVMYGDVIRAGDRVKHYGQRYTGQATATVLGFARIGDAGVPNPMGFRDGWIKVLVTPDSDRDVYGAVWDWDRTERRSHAAI